MSLEVTCKICDEEYDMRHGTCPACKWRVKRVAQLEAKLAVAEMRSIAVAKENELYKQRIVFEQACRFADAQNDYDMAAYALRDLPLTGRAKLADLAQAMQSEGCSKGDWVGLRDLWDKAYREAIGGEY